MPRIFKLGTAAVAIVLATAAVGIIAYDRSQANQTEQWLHYDFSALSRTSTLATTVRGNVAAETQSIRYRVNATPKTVFDLGQKRNGCILIQALPPTAVCDIATAFPDVGLDGNVMFIGTTRARDDNTLNAFRLGK